jgi:hypothetical protein
MQIIVKTSPEELLRAKKWWNDLEMQWKMVYNETIFGNGPSLEPPKDDALMLLLIRVDTLRFAGPFAVNPNTSIKLTNLSGLTPLYHLKYLSISNMAIESLEELKNHVNIEHLFVYENRLKSLKGIEGMRNLKELYFQTNEVSDLHPLEKLHKLETVYANFNNITSLKGIKKKHAKSLRNLYVLPNDKLKDKEIIRVQNKLGILCKKA